MQRATRDRTVPVEKRYTDGAFAVATARRVPKNP
jgi:hypothetical protein